jgi:hypothetical protein
VNSGSMRDCNAQCCSELRGGRGKRTACPTEPRGAGGHYASAALLNLLAKRRRCNTVGRIIL